MRALVYHGTGDVRVDSVPDPVLQEPDDILLRVTATAICGSDLHHRLSLEDAARGYEIFDNKEQQCRKVVLTPGKKAGA